MNCFEIYCKSERRSNGSFDVCRVDKRGDKDFIINEKWKKDEWCEWKGRRMDIILK